jgi:3'(2'), 5'-bisphosphate nucleotidase
VLEILSDISVKASKIIMEIYGRKDFGLQYKEDKSPVTEADLGADAVIRKALNEHFDWPILSEEKLVAYEERRHWQRYWLVDPLDGTKSFVKREDDFTVNIALIDNKKPVAAVLTLPVTGDVYTAEKGKGCFKNGEKIFNNATRKELIASASRAHTSKSTQKFLKDNGIHEVRSRASSLKFGLLAEGAIDVYPRLGPTSEWDIAAGEIVCTEAGCELYQSENNQALEYNKENLLNPDFIACRQGLRFKI